MDEKMAGKPKTVFRVAQFPISHSLPLKAARMRLLLLLMFSQQLK